MAEAYIVDAVRTAGGRRGGALREWHPADLGAAVLDALVERSGIDPAAVEDVIFGCVDTVRRLINRHRDERACYRRALRIVDQHDIPVLNATDGYLWPPEPPPDQETLVDLLQRELGAYLIDA